MRADFGHQRHAVTPLVPIGKVHRPCAYFVCRVGRARISCRLLVSKSLGDITRANLDVHRACAHLLWRKTLGDVCVPTLKGAQSLCPFRTCAYFLCPTRTGADFLCPFRTCAYFLCPTRTGADFLCLFLTCAVFCARFGVGPFPCRFKAQHMLTYNRIHSRSAKTLNLPYECPVFLNGKWR